MISRYSCSRFSWFLLNNCPSFLSIIIHNHLLETAGFCKALAQDNFWSNFLSNLSSRLPLASRSSWCSDIPGQIHVSFQSEVRPRNLSPLLTHTKHKFFFPLFLPSFRLPKHKGSCRYSTGTPCTSNQQLFIPESLISVITHPRKIILENAFIPNFLQLQRQILKDSPGMGKSRFQSEICLRQL